MRWPTIKEGVSVVAGIVGTLSVLGGAAWSYDRHVEDRIQAVENHAVASIQTLRCDIIDSKITELISKREAEGLTPREKARLEQLMREWQRVCTGDS